MSRGTTVGQAGSLRRVGDPAKRRLSTGAQLNKLPHMEVSA